MRKIVQALLAINALIWTGLGAGTLMHLGDVLTSLKTIMGIMGVMMFGNAGAFLFSAWVLPKKRMPAFIFALLLLIVNILLTFTDQIGFWDWTTVLVDFLLFGILLGQWRFFTGRN